MWRSGPALGARPARCAHLLVLLVSVVAGCAPELEKLDHERSDRGTIGAEAYKALCRRVAGTEIPDDLDGRQTEDLCLRDAATADQALADGRSTLPARLVALAERRAEIVQAIDDVFPGDLSDELEVLMRNLLPYYDPPEERIQKGTRALAAVLEHLAGNAEALAGLEKLGRDGMVPPEGAFGLYRSLLSYPGVGSALKAVLPVLTTDSEVRPYFKTMGTGLALELATSELDDGPDSDTRKLKDLLLRTDSGFASKTPLFTAVRDARGYPVPTPSTDKEVPFPFVDADKDGLADIKDGDFVLDPGFKGALPAPFAVQREEGVSRDELGRAYAFTATGEVDKTRTLFQTTDADDTLLAAAMREAAKLFAEDTKIATRLANVFPVLFGERVATEKAYGKASFEYEAPNVEKSPALDLVHASTVMVDRPIYDQSLDLTLRLIENEEPTWVAALDPLLVLEKRTRAGSDAYPDAKLKQNSLFWDELLWEVEKLSRRRKSKDGETALEALVRGSLGFARNLQKPGAPIEQVMDPKVLRHQGAVFATLMRFKDEWRSNPIGESKRKPDEPAVIGGFAVPVDRSQPDAPTTCGKDGCGGLVKGTPFERWAKPNQKCVIQREGRPASGVDCGAAPNQSIYHRSLGLIWEMAGRSQCNKVVTLGDLLDFAVLKDPCANVEPVTSCSADADCATAFGSTDYACDKTLDAPVCIIKKGSPTCQQLKQKQQQDRQNTIKLAADAVAEDYACPADKPSAACHAFENPYSAAFIDTDGKTGPAEAGIQACHLMNLPDVGRTFGRALTHEFVIEVPNPWVRRYLEDIARDGDDSIPDCPASYDIVDPNDVPPCIPNAAHLSRSVYEDMPASVDTLGELIEFLLDDSSLFATPEDTAELRPDVKALSRVLFAPAGSSSFLVFDPLLIHGAPPVCSAAPGLPKCDDDDTAATPAGGCCIDNLKKPPLRYRLDTYYGATTFSWEQPIKFTDGTSLSFIDSMKTISDAVNRTDFDADAGDDPKSFEGTDYVFSTIGKIVAQHYDSPKNPAVQNTDPTGANFRYLTNLVSYESMLADALDDGTIDVQQAGPAGGTLFDPSVTYTKEQQLGLVYQSFPILQTLDAMDFGNGVDGIDLSTELAEQLMSAHAWCAGANGDRRVLDGKGACHLAEAGMSGFNKPVTFRDSRAYMCWNDGRCYDGNAYERRFVSPLYLALEPLHAIDQAIENDPVKDEALDLAIGGMLDSYAATEDGLLKDRRLRALLIVVTKYIRERLADEKDKGTLDTLAARTLEDAVDLVQNPVFAGGLDMLVGMLDNPEALDAMSALAFGVLDDSEDPASLRALLAAAADLLQSLPGDGTTNELVRALSVGVVPNVDDYVRGEGSTLSFDEGLLWQNLTLINDTLRFDESDVLGRVLGNVARVPSDASAARRAPLEVLFHDVMALNRVTPGSDALLSRDDWKTAMTRIAEVMRDERRGFERLYRIVQCRNAGPSDKSCQ